MSDSNVIKLAQPGAFSDRLTEILRSGTAPAWASTSSGAPAIRYLRPMAQHRQTSRIPTLPGHDARPALTKAYTDKAIL